MINEYLGYLDNQPARKALTSGEIYMLFSWEEDEEQD